MYNREIQKELLRLNAIFPVVTITGPRQSGKTTLCKMAFPDYEYINLENPLHRANVSDNPVLFLQNHANGLIIDEAQNMPEVFSAVQVVVDENKSCKYIITGSSNFKLLSKVKQSLAGRTAVLTLLPLSLKEIGKEGELSVDEQMLYGGFPAVWGDKTPFEDVYRAYYQTYIQRDVQDVINIQNLSQFQRFLLLLAARVGTELNAQNLSDDVGVTVATIQNWVSVLEASYVAFRLPPYFRNVGKRLIKASKIYFYDTGLVCHLLGIHSANQLNMHQFRGSIFENMVVCEFMKSRYNSGKEPSIYFYRDNSKEVDLLVEDGLNIDAYEIKVSNNDNTSFYKNLDYLRKLYGDFVVSTSVIYTGKECRHVQFNGLIPYNMVK